MSAEIKFGLDNYSSPLRVSPGETVMVKGPGHLRVEVSCDPADELTNLHMTEVRDLGTIEVDGIPTVTPIIVKIDDLTLRDTCGYGRSVPEGVTPDMSFSVFHFQGS